MSLNGAGAAGLPPQTTVDALLVQNEGGNSNKPKVEITPTNNIGNFDPLDNRVGAGVEVRIGDDGRLIFEAGEIPGVNGTNPETSIGIEYDVEPFGLGATVNQPGTSEASIDVGVSLDIGDNEELTFGIESIDDDASYNFGVSKTDGDTKLSVEGEVNHNDASIEFRIENEF